MKQVVLLDNEAVQALLGVAHPRRGRVLEVLGAVTGRRKRAIPIEVIVPTAVRVEAGWNRRDPVAARINRFQIRDDELDRASADTAVEIRKAHRVSVADAHLGAVIAARTGDAVITVVTSDPEDIRAVAGSTHVNVVRL